MKNFLKYFVIAVMAVAVSVSADAAEMQKGSKPKTAKVSGAKKNTASKKSKARKEGAEEKTSVEEEVLWLERAPVRNDARYVDERNVGVIDDSGIVDVDYTEDPVVYTVYDGTMPCFPGGDSALAKFLAANLTYPEEAAVLGIEGKVYVAFVVYADGTVCNVEIAKGVHPSLDAEAMRVVGLMPKFNPGTYKGQPVNVRYTLPINFKLTRSDEISNRSEL